MPPLPPELPSGYHTPPKSPIIQPQATTPPPPLPTNQDPSMLSALGTAAALAPEPPDSWPLVERLKWQCRFWFSDDHLQQSTFMASYAGPSGTGWVPIGVLMSFPRIASGKLKAEVPIVVEALRQMEELYVSHDGGYVARRYPIANTSSEYQKWLVEKEAIEYAQEEEAKAGGVDEIEWPALSEAYKKMKQMWAADKTAAEDVEECDDCADDVEEEEDDEESSWC